MSIKKERPKQINYVSQKGVNLKTDFKHYSEDIEKYADKLESLLDEKEDLNKAKTQRITENLELELNHLKQEKENRLKREEMKEVLKEVIRFHKEMGFTPHSTLLKIADLTKPNK